MTALPAPELRREVTGVAVLAEAEQPAAQERPRLQPGHGGVQRDEALPRPGHVVDPEEQARDDRVGAAVSNDDQPSILEGLVAGPRASGVLGGAQAALGEQPEQRALH